MKLVKKWLFPILTCLIIIGAAILPPLISQVKDSQQFAQIHISELNADALPVREGRNQLERLELCARWHTNSEIIPSFQIPVLEVDLADTELAEQALNFLTQADVIPARLLLSPMERISMDRILLWDTKDSMSSQEPVEFWRVTADFGNCHIWMTVDSESGLPLTLSLSDPNMAQWLLYKDPDTLPNMAERYFDLLDLEAGLVETGILSDATPWERYFIIEGTEVRYGFVFNATQLTIGPRAW